MINNFDVIIIGAGPAGLTAALYAKRLGLETVIFERMLPGGQVLLTDRIDNYPGFKPGPSSELVEHFISQVKAVDVGILQKEISGVVREAGVFKVKTSKEQFSAKAVIIATGALPKKLGLESEAKFSGKGVSYCAVCDGPIFRNKVVCVVGGGDRALEEAIYLSRICAKVYLAHRRDAFRAFKVLQDEVYNNQKITLLLNSVVEEFTGDNCLRQIKIKNVLTGAQSSFDINGVFIAVGTSPNTKFLQGAVETDKEGFIKTDDQMNSSVKGIFAAGDVRIKILRQVVTATNDGAIAAFSAYQYIKSI